MTFLLALIAGAVLSAALLPALRGVLDQPLFARENHRGASLPTAGGLVLVVAALAVEAVWATGELAGLDAASAPARRLVLLAVVGFGFLGLIDDVAGSGADGRGFRGHLRAAFHGQLTTGGLKLAGGAALAVVVARPAGGDSFWQLVGDALLVALAANLGNLFDRAPGRTIKVSVFAGLVLVVAVGFEGELTGVAAALGAALALAPADLRERLMLGDTGANALGAALGLGVVLTCAPGVRWGVLVVLVVLNASSEVVSFSRVIDAVPPLRMLDRAGRRR